MGFSCKEISRDLKQSFPIWTCQRLILPKIVSFQLKISVPVCKTTRSRVSTCKGLWTNKRPQKEEEKTGNTCIWNMGKVKNEIKVYISAAKSIPAGPIVPLICLFSNNTYKTSDINNKTHKCYVSIAFSANKQACFNFSFQENTSSHSVGING